MSGVLNLWVEECPLPGPGVATNVSGEVSHRTSAGPWPAASKGLVVEPGSWLRMEVSATITLAFTGERRARWTARSGQRHLSFSRADWDERLRPGELIDIQEPSRAHHLDTFLNQSHRLADDLARIAHAIGFSDPGQMVAGAVATALDLVALLALRQIELATIFPAEFCKASRFLPWCELADGSTLVVTDEWSNEKRLQLTRARFGNYLPVVVTQTDFARLLPEHYS